MSLLSAQLDPFKKNVDVVKTQWESLGWGGRQQVRIRVGLEGALHIQTVAQGALARLVNFLAKFLLGKGWKSIGKRVKDFRTLTHINVLDLPYKLSAEQKTALIGQQKIKLFDALKTLQASLKDLTTHLYKQQEHLIVGSSKYVALSELITHVDELDQSIALTVLSEKQPQELYQKFKECESLFLNLKQLSLIKDSIEQFSSQGLASQSSLESLTAKRSSSPKTTLNPSSISIDIPMEMPQGGVASVSNSAPENLSPLKPSPVKPNPLSEQHVEATSENINDGLFKTLSQQVGSLEKTMRNEGYLAIADQLSKIGDELTKKGVRFYEDTPSENSSISTLEFDDYLKLQKLTNELTRLVDDWKIFEKNFEELQGHIRYFVSQGLKSFTEVQLFDFRNKAHALFVKEKASLFSIDQLKQIEKHQKDSITILYPSLKAYLREKEDLYQKECAGIANPMAEQIFKELKEQRRNLWGNAFQDPHSLSYSSFISKLKETVQNDVITKALLSSLKGQTRGKSNVIEILFKEIGDAISQSLPIPTHDESAAKECLHLKKSIVSASNKISFVQLSALLEEIDKKVKHQYQEPSTNAQEAANWQRLSFEISARLAGIELYRNTIEAKYLAMQRQVLRLCEEWEQSKQYLLLHLLEEEFLKQQASVDKWTEASIAEMGERTEAMGRAIARMAQRLSEIKNKKSDAISDLESLQLLHSKWYRPMHTALIEKIHHSLKTYIDSLNNHLDKINQFLKFSIKPNPQLQEIKKTLETKVAEATSLCTGFTCRQPLQFFKHTLSLDQLSPSQLKDYALAVKVTIENGKKELSAIWPE